MSETPRFSYLLNHWQALTLFLREKRAPLDKNISAIPADTTVHRL